MFIIDSKRDRVLPFIILWDVALQFSLKDILSMSNAPCRSDKTSNIKPNGAKLALQVGQLNLCG